MPKRSESEDQSQRQSASPLAYRRPWQSRLIQGTSNKEQMIASCFIFQLYARRSPLHAGLHRKPSCFDSPLERLVVSFRLVGIQAGKSGEGAIGGVTFA